jgi:MtrB/PioB family decaheme-associated outer membrane protein
MSMKKRTFRLTALAAALAGVYGVAQAQAQQEAQDPAITELTKPESAVSLGIGAWSDDRPKLGTYDGMRDKGAYGLFDARINSRDDRTGTWFILDARNLGLDTRQLRADWLRQGNMGVFLEYNRMVRDEPNTVLTNTLGVGTPTQRTPAVGAANGSPIHLGTMREGFGAGFNTIFGGGYDFRFSARSENKTGDRLWGRGGAPEFAAEPIDSNIRQLEAALAYTGKAFQVEGGYYGSWYTNHNSLVDTANISTAGVLSNQFFLSLPLDNQAHQAYVNGGYNFSDRTRGTFKVSYTRATQDEIIPVGQGVAVSPTAPTSLDGRIDNTLAQIGLTQRTTNAFSWLASLRYYKTDEKTPQFRVVQTNPACPAVGNCVDTTPLTYETTTGKLEGTYRFGQGWSVLGGLEYSKQDRQVPVGTFNASGVDIQRFVPWRSELDETTIRIEARRSLSETLNGRIALAHSERDGSDFTATNEAQSNLINPIYIADRDRDKVKLMLDWAPTQPLTLTFNVEYAKDDYGTTDARPFGLRDGTAAVYSIDAGYAISENWQVSAWYTRDEVEANQFGQRNANSGAAEAVKEANLKQVGDTFGAGVRGVLMPKLRAGLEMLFSKSVNQYPETITPTGAGALFPTSGTVTAVGPLPDITNKTTRVNLFGVYALQKNSDLRVDYIYERWQTDDWTWFFADRATPFTYGATADGTQVVQAPKQTSNFLGVRYIYKFQ